MEHSWEESQRNTFLWYQGWSRLHGGECCGLCVECFAADQGHPPEMVEGPHCWDQSLEGLNQERKGGTEMGEGCLKQVMMVLHCWDQTLEGLNLERMGGTEVGKGCLKQVMRVLSLLRGDDAVPSVCITWCLYPMIKGEHVQDTLAVHAQ